jgi:hypothetical protein
MQVEEPIQFSFFEPPIHYEQRKHRNLYSWFGMRERRNFSWILQEFELFHVNPSWSFCVLRLSPTGDSKPFSTLYNIEKIPFSICSSSVF